MFDLTLSLRDGGQLGENSWENEAWTVTLVSPRIEEDGRVYERSETNFGLFRSSAEASEAMDSGNVEVRGDRYLTVSRIRAFPTQH